MSRFVYGNPSVLDLCVEHGIKVLDCSKVVYGYGEWPYITAELSDEDADKLLAVDEKEFEDRGAWYREVGRANTFFDPYRPRVMRQVGLHEYICDGAPESLGASQPRNVAAIIGEICAEEHKTPIQLFNSLKTMKG